MAHSGILPADKRTMALLVNGEYVDDALLKAEARSIRPRLYEAMQGESPAKIEERVTEWSRENVIERVLLRQEVMADQTPVDAAECDAIVAQSPGMPREEAEAALRIQRLMKRLTAKLSAPRHKDVVEFYRKNQTKFYAAEAVHAAHIVKNVDELVSEDAARGSIEAAARELEAGASFEELSDRLSDCPGRGGDLGFFSRGEMVNEFEQVVFGLAQGQVSPVFRTPFGFHIAKVYERRAEGILRLEEVRGQIEEALMNEKRERALGQLADRLRAKAVVTEVARRENREA
jgi:hypothetical protein